VDLVVGDINGGSGFEVGDSLISRWIRPGDHGNELDACARVRRGPKGARVACWLNEVGAGVAVVVEDDILLTLGARHTRC